jgi:hypothetical protein
MCGGMQTHSNAFHFLIFHIFILYFLYSNGNSRFTRRKKWNGKKLNCIFLHFIYLKIRFLDSSIFLSHRGRKKTHVQIFWRSVHYLLEPTQKPICFRSHTAADQCQVNQKRTGKNASLKRKYHKILYDWFRVGYLYYMYLKRKCHKIHRYRTFFRISVADPNPFHANPGPDFALRRIQIRIWIGIQPFMLRSQSLLNWSTWFFVFLIHM